MTATKEFELRTIVCLDVPKEVEIDGRTAEPEQYDDGEGDYIEYVGYSDEDAPYSDWRIYIQPERDGMVYVRATLDDDELDSAEIDLNAVRSPTLTEVVEEYAEDIRREIARVRRTAGE